MADWGDQEQLSLAYVMAVAAAAGCVCEPAYRGSDNAGVDLRIFPREPHGNHFRLGLQVKSKLVKGVAGRSDWVTVDLSRKQYEDLTFVSSGTAMLLVVVLIPSERSEWLAQTVDQMVLRRCGYWLSLRGLPRPTSTVRQRIRIPRSQVFEPGVLRAMISSIKRVNMIGEFEGERQ